MKILSLFRTITMVKIDSKVVDVGLMTLDSQINHIVDWIDNVNFIVIEKLFE